MCFVWISEQTAIIFLYSINLPVFIKISPITGPRCPEGSRKLRFPDYVAVAQNGGKVVSLTHRPFLPPGNTPGIHFFWRLSRPQGHSAIGRIMSMKNSNDTIWNRTTDLPICSAAPSPLCYRGLVFITERNYVYFAVRAESLYTVYIYIYNIYK